MGLAPFLTHSKTNNVMEEDTLKKVIDFFGGNSSTPINGNTEINNDLKITGDDAYFILLDFEKKFNVSLKGIDLNDYFVPEMVFKYWYYKWFKPEKLKRKPLTIGHMAEVAKKGYWFEP